MASAQDVICEQCVLPSHEKLEPDCVDKSGVAVGADVEVVPKSTYVGGMSSILSTSVEVRVGCVTISAAALIAG
ncbi:hypothetical protein [Psychrobacter sp. P11G3]|uniref:hypothetical protein n=1 Tax=Psychrobacter sp. P11G3 TaxID=1699623 RepID=UPI00070DECBE|nr:hypothetical protein [Psychrobacter sp. P11G3]KRG36947.1 hypothetical protein AK824_07670 [Psychrobacter sp. P11G3]